MLTEAVLAPGSMPPAPKATQAIPKPRRPIPIAHFIFALGLYLLSHHLENNGASVIINSEFSTENQEAGTSVWSFSNSAQSIHIAIPQTIKKLKDKKILDSAYLAKVFLNSITNTQVITPSGTMVINEFTILNVSPALPANVRCV